MPDPTQADLQDPLFEVIWQAIKGWDVNVPAYYHGYSGATGSHVMLILKEIRKCLAGMDPAVCMRCTRTMQSMGDLEARVKTKVKIGMNFNIEVNLCPSCQDSFRENMRKWVLDRPEIPIEKRNLIL